ncbi:MAG: RNA replicase beta chain [Sanya fiers-like virus 12]|nr:MAG: RNA replicase beta chain [Sanya fiers-like virus 12]
MNNPKPHGSKLKSQTSKNKTLRREVTQEWNRPIPRAARAPIWRAVLSSVRSCLSEDLPPTVAQRSALAVESGDLRSVIDLKKELVSPQLYGTAQSYFTTAVLLNLFAKTELPVKGLDPLAKGVDRFREAEKLCRITNRRLRHYRTFDHASRPLVKRLDVHQIFHLARRKIERWLGPLDVDAILTGARHGPGGVVGLKRPKTTPYYKFATSEYTCSKQAYWYALKALAANDAWVRALALEQGVINNYDEFCHLTWHDRLKIVDQNITITDQNEVTFVNKDATVKRSISIEPALNVYLQLGVGHYFKGVLKLAGCDLSDQTRNQELARIGSMYRDLWDPVTLDLAMASDTLSIELVRELLPIEWFEFLDDLRSHHGSYRGEVFRWNKFSSMGNGFTFELESLIFYALAQACSDHVGTTHWFSDTFGPAYKYAYVSVYGDDIIVPKSVAGHLTAVLRYAGFRLNSDKSFVEGPFRESCGEDFWDGVRVRPFFMKRGLLCVRDLIHLHNGLKELSNESLGGKLAPTLEMIRKMLPDVVERHLRGVEPTTDDGYIWVEPDEAMSSKLVAWHADWQRWTFPLCRTRPVMRQGGRSMWRLVQLLYASTDRELRQADLPDKPVEIHYVSGGSRSDVVESGRGTPSFAMA